MLAARGGDGQESLDEDIAGFAGRAEARLAPDDGRPQSAFGPIVGRFDGGMIQASEEGRPKLAEFGAQRVELGVWQFQTAPQQRPESGLQHADLVSSCRLGDRSVPDLAMQDEESSLFPPQTNGDLRGRLASAFEGFKIPLEVGMAKAPVGQRNVVVGFGPVADHLGTGNVGTEEFPTGILGAVLVQAEQRPVVGYRHPQPATLTGFLETSLVDVGDGADPHGLGNSVHRRCQRVADPVADGHDRAQRHVQAGQIGDELQSLTAAEPITSDQAGDQRFQVGTKTRARHRDRQVGNRYCAASLAAPPLAPMLGDRDVNRWDLADLVQRRMPDDGAVREAVTAVAAVTGMMVNTVVHPLGWQHFPRMAVMAGLSATLAARRRFDRFGDRWRIRTGWLVGVAGILIQSGFEFGHLRSQRSDLSQHGQDECLRLRRRTVPDVGRQRGRSWRRERHAHVLPQPYAA